MPVVAGIRFNNTNKTYYFDPAGKTLEPGQGVVVETARGVEFGVVSMANTEVPDARVVKPLKPVLRLAEDKDYKQIEHNETRKPEALRITQEKIFKHKLDMKLVDAEYTFDNSKLVIYFTAAARVDFRDLVKDLASVFHIRIELRQISVRDECRLLGGLAPCGRECCCSSHLAEFERVSLKMAKNQSLSLNPAKISGLCGKLMCCLEYENDHYKETAKRMPRVNSEVVTPDGRGTVISNNFLKELVKVRIAVKDTFEFRDYKLSQLKSVSAVADDNEDVAVNDEMKELLD